MKKIVIFIPAFNAEGTIRDVFKRIPKSFLEKEPDILIVNDGSTDSTKFIIENLQIEYPHVYCIEHKTNMGYGATQKTAYDWCKKVGADIIVMLHSDGQYAPELLQDMIAPIEKGDADVVGGSRILGGKMLDGGMPLHKYVGNKILTWMENKVFKTDLHSYHSGYKAYNKKAIELIPYCVYSDYYYFDSEMLVGAICNNLKISEIAIPTRYAGETSHLKPIKYGVGILKIIYAYWFGGYSLPKLSDKEFKKLKQSAPLVCIDLIVKDGDKILLGKRNTYPYKDYWHTPGGLLYYKESIDNAMKRIARREIGIGVEKIKLLKVHEYNGADPRGHFIGLTYVVKKTDGEIKPTNDNSDFQFFDKIPEEIFPTQEILIKEALKG